MKLLCPILAAALLLSVTGCKPKPKEISTLQRKEAANLVSEASFAMTLRDYTRAAPLLEKAAKLCPDNGEYWINLGIVRRRQNDKPGAKTAYESGLTAYRDAVKLHPEDSALWLQQVYVLALLGRGDDARTALEKARKQNPNNRELRQFAETRQLDHMLGDPQFKELSL